MIQIGKKLLIDGYTRDADISVWGRKKTNYYFSVSYNDTKGIVRGNELTKLTLEQMLVIIFLISFHCQ